MILLRPDGEKKAYVRLAPDYDALDVANKVKKKKTSNNLFQFYITFRGKSKWILLTVS